MKALVFDPFTINISHLSFNITIIRSIVGIPKVNSVKVLLSNTQTKNKVFDEIKSNDKTKFEDSLANSRLNKNKFTFLLFTITSYFKLLFSLITYKPDTLFVLSSDNLYGPILLRIIINIFKLDVYIFLHNNIENSKSSYLKKTIWSSLLIKRTHGIVLSEFVLNRSINLFSNSLNIHLLPHPSYAHLVNDIELQNDKTKIDFLLLGRHSKYFYENDFAKTFFADFLKKEGENKIKIALRKSNLNVYENDKIEFIEYEFPITDEEYWDLLKRTKFLIIPPQSKTRITASGVHIDAITMGVPVLAPKKGTFLENVNVLGKELLFDDDDLSECFKKVFSLNEDDYEVLKSEVESISNSLSLKENSKRINEILKNTCKKYD
jgi:hypothetical protein